MTATSSTATSASATEQAARVEADQAPSRLGPWELVRLIGEGRLASVYAARPSDKSPDEPASYAIKLLRPQWQDDSRGLALLARETHVARKVTHPHLVPVLAAQLTEPPYYLAMPLLEGHSLAEQLAAHGQLELPLAFWIARQVAEALVAMHTAGWRHGDVKPSNIVVSPCGHATLIDLGFARHADEKLTITDRPLLGTVHYIAPEVLFSALGGETPSDIYSLGVTLFEMLTGRLPFDADEIAELANQHRQELPGNLRVAVPHLPTRAARLAQQMLAKEPLRRPTAAELVNRLAALEIETFAERFTFDAADVAEGAGE